MKKNVRSGIWTHALFRRPELESGALDHSAILTICLLPDQQINSHLNYRNENSFEDNQTKLE